jgi:hypothetical protein
VLQAGKTSLVRALISPSSKCASIHADHRTVGIDHFDNVLLRNAKGVTHLVKRRDIASVMEAFGVDQALAIKALKVYGYVCYRAINIFCVFVTSSLFVAMPKKPF